jgi:hypothetical protein
LNRTNAFVRLSPWPLRLLNAAVGRLRAVFTPTASKRVFADPTDSPTLSSLLLGLSAPANSEFLRIGFDLCRVGRIPARLAHRLAIETSHHGARFELRVLAAARWASTRFRFEPLRNRLGRGPDLLLQLEEPVFAELKAPSESEVWRQRDRTYQTIVFGGRDDAGMHDLMYVDMSFTDEFRRLDATHEGRCLLERNADRLGRAAGAAARHMIGKSIVVDDLLRLTITNGRLGEREPLAPDYTYEAERVLEGPVSDACNQLPHDRPGIVIVETERSWAPLHQLQQETVRWLSGPVGREYPHVAGILYTHRPWWSNFPGMLLVPVWRRAAPRWLVQSQQLRNLENGLCRADLRAWDWKKKRHRA